MSKTRESKKLLTEQLTIEDAEAIFAEYAAADAQEQKITAQMDIAITKIREKYQDELAELADKKRNAFERLQHFATNSPELFTQKKSIELTHGKLGFRTGTPALKTLKGFTWGSTLNLVKEFLPGFVRIKEEVDKEGLLAKREEPGVQPLLTKCGLRVEQAETFFVEPKKEETVA
ncbi:MAG: host-nuclease inhibitor Gam family protein [Chitinophagales bacterium]|nr:host-nuclease inhibitor Gam family protein [Chitinophagales bacterium]